MSVVVGPGHPNSGAPGTVDLVGNLYVGGSGVWVFTPLDPASRYRAISLSSGRDLSVEIRAGVAISLGLGSARELAGLPPTTARRAGPARVESPKDGLGAIADQGRDLGVALWVSSPHEDLLRDVAPLADEEGWSVVILARRAQHLETQWG